MDQNSKNPSLYSISLIEQNLPTSILHCVYVADRGLYGMAHIANIFLPEIIYFWSSTNLATFFHSLKQSFVKTVDLSRGRPKNKIGETTIFYKVVSKFLLNQKGGEFCTMRVVEQHTLYRIHYTTITSNSAFWNNQELCFSCSRWAVKPYMMRILFSKVKSILTWFDAPFHKESEYCLGF